MEEIKIGSKIYLERFDGNGIPEKWLVTDIFKTNLGKLYVETVRGLIDWEQERLVVVYDNSGSPEAYSYVNVNQNYQIDVDVMISLRD